MAHWVAGFTLVHQFDYSDPETKCRLRIQTPRFETESEAESVAEHLQHLMAGNGTAPRVLVTKVD